MVNGDGQQGGGKKIKQDVTSCSMGKENYPACISGWHQAVSTTFNQYLKNVSILSLVPLAEAGFVI